MGLPFEEEYKKMSKINKTASHLSNFGKGAYSSVGVRDSQIEQAKSAYKKQDEKKDVYINEGSMFTGDPWFDIGLAIGRKQKEKKSKS